MVKIADYPNTQNSKTFDDNLLDYGGERFDEADVIDADGDIQMNEEEKVPVRERRKKRTENVTGTAKDSSRNSTLDYLLEDNSNTPRSTRLRGFAAGAGSTTTTMMNQLRGGPTSP